MKTFASAQTQHSLLAAQKALQAGDYQKAAEHQAAFPSDLDYPPWRERAPAPDLQRQLAAVASLYCMGTAAVPLHAADVELAVMLCQDPMPHQTRQHQQTVQRVVGRVQLFGLQQVSGPGLAL